MQKSPFPSNSNLDSWTKKSEGGSKDPDEIVFSNNEWVPAANYLQ